MDPTPPKRRKLGHSGVSPSITSRGSAFVLETEELLREVKVDYAKAFSGADEFLHKIKDSIERIEPHEPRPIHEASSALTKTNGIRVPFPDPKPPRDSKYKVAFAKPAQLNVVGSYVSRTMVRTQTDPAVDMIVVLPPEILQEKDYLDLRYFYKRAYYLAVVAGALRREFGDSSELSFCYENPLAPALALRPKPESEAEEEEEEEEEEDDASGGSKSKPGPSAPGFRIRIIPCAPEGFFPQQKLHANAVLIRRGSDDGKDAAKPTPFYNWTLKAEGLYPAYLRLFRKVETSCSSFNEACLLGRIWLTQRGFEGSGFGHFEWAAMLAVLLQTNDKSGRASLSTSLTGVQLFRAAIQFLSVANFATKPCILGSAKAESVSTKDGPVIYDAAREMNIAFKVSSGAALMLHQYAKWTHALLSDGLQDQFSPTFILRSDVPLLAWDLVAELKCDAAFLEKTTKNASSSCRGQLWDLCDRVYSVLKRALGEKARLVYVSEPAAPSSLLSGAPTVPGSQTLRIGVLFGPDMARRIDRGPAVEEKKEAARFLQFWGDKSELRRFEDGETRETLIWQSTTPEGICEEVMRYILQKHLRLGHIHAELEFYGNRFASLVPILPTDASLFSVARKEFATFEQDVRNLGDDFPLQVRRLLPICPELRHASIRPPSFDTSKSGPQPMETVIYFEASGKWPDNLAAVQRLKIALLLKLGSLLEAAKPEKVKSYLGLEDAKLDNENLAFLDVVYDSGASFRLRIHSDLEETLLERTRDNKTLGQHMRTESATLLATVRRLYTHLPLHNQTISTYATRFPALSPTIRLLSSWFSAHKLSTHFLDEFVELVALRVFLAPYPWDAPSSANTGFLRALLFLSRWDWRSEPLVVDTGGDMTAADHGTIETRLAAFRKLDPNMNSTVLVAATGGDGTGTAYTTSEGQPKPPKVVATRMTALARSATQLVRDQAVRLDAKALFVSALKDYDVLIFLNKKVVRSLLHVYATDADADNSDADNGTGRSRFKNLDTRTGQVPLPLVDHPVRVFLRQLEAAYAGPLLFFYGAAATDVVIGAVWNPQLRLRSFRARLPASYRPVAGRGQGAKSRAVGDGNDIDEDEDDGDHSEDEETEDIVEINREAILAEIARVGSDLVERIETKSE